MENIFINYFKKNKIKLSEKSWNNLTLIKNIRVEKFLSIPKNETRYKWFCDYDGTSTALNFVRKNSKKIMIEKLCYICESSLGEQTLSKQFSFIYSSNNENLKPSSHLNKMCFNCARRENSKNGLEKRKKTCLDKYGIEYKILDSDVIKNRKKILTDRYGENYKEFFWEKAKNTYIRKLGVSHNTKIPEVLEKMVKNRLETLKTLSPEKWKEWSDNRINAYNKEGSSGLFGRNDFDGNSKIAKDFISKLINVLNLQENEYITEKPHSKYNIDLYIKDLVIVEFYGDFWHANPEIYKPDDIIGVSYNTITAKEKWEKDAYRIEKLKNELNLPVIIVWEKSYKENKDKIILDIIKNINIIKTNKEIKTYVY
jgi:hypothetical protein